MARITRAQVDKMNEAMANGWSLDLQYLIMRNEKTATQRTEPDENGVIYESTLSYIEERDGEGWMATRTGRQLVQLSVRKLIPTERNKHEDECVMYSVNFISDEIIGEPQSRRMFSYIQKLTHSLDFNEIIAKARGGISEEPEEAESQVDYLTDSDAPVCEGMQFVDGSGDLVKITKLDTMQIEFNGGEKSIYDFGTSRTVGAILDALGDGSRIIDPAQGARQEEWSEAEATEEPEQTTEEETEAEPIEPTTEPTQTYTEPTDTAQTDKSTTEAEQTATADENTPQGAQAEEPEQQTASPDYTALAAAYLAGKTLKGTTKPQNATSTGKAANTAHKEPDAPQEPQTPPTPPLKSEYGYTGELSHRFTPEEIETLTEGGQVECVNKWHQSALFFTVPYTEKTSLLYCVPTTGGKVNPGKEANYAGFITGGNYYPAESRAIDDELQSDISTAILQKIPTEQAAQENAERIKGADNWEIESIAYLKEYDGKDEARRQFCKEEEPELTAYKNHWQESEKDRIEYIEEPGAYIERRATDYIEARPVELLKAYYIYNRIAPEFYNILYSPDDIAHELKRMAASVTNEKTVRIELTDGDIVKTEANAVKHIGSRGKIYSSNTDRGGKDIQPEEIKAIYHGQRVLYRAA